MASATERPGIASPTLEGRRAGASLEKTAAGIRSRQQARRRARRARRILLLAALVAAWWALGLRVSPLFLAGPVATASALVQLVATGELLAAFLDSLRPLVIGYGLAIAAGIVVGLAIGLYRTVDFLLDMYVTILLVAPLVAFIPILIALFGLDLAARSSIVFLFVVVFVIINTATGVKTVPRDLLEMGRSFLLSESQLLRWVVLPSAAPLIMASIRVGFGRAIMGMLLGEMLVTQAGLGGLLLEFRDNFRAAQMFATIGAMLAFAVVGGSLILSLERRLVHRPGFEGGGSGA